MKRNALTYLAHWKADKLRKPLLIKGARQVGKTWLMKSFGKTDFENVIYVNFEKDKLLQNLFEQDFDIQRILLALKIHSGITAVPEKTLLIFDEIQEAKGALTSLKYFSEDAPEYHIIGAGSLLGIALHQTSFPVGKIDFMELHPLSFGEFLQALGENELYALLQQNDWQMIHIFRERYTESLRQYYFTGGMPEAVYYFSMEKDFAGVRKIQDNILTAYQQDFSKHAPNEIVPRIRMLWNSVPSQLSKENKKFIYGLIKEGSRAKEYENALNWIEDYGLMLRVNRVTKPALPLKAYTDNKAFKLYISDVGLLGALAGLNEKVLLEGNRLFTEFKGALTEQYVLQQLVAENNIRPFYWSEEKSTGEIDFIIEHQNHIIPIEVKAEENLQAKSLKFFHQKYEPPVSIRTSLSDYRKESWLLNIPLYGIGQVNQVLNFEEII
ncbi:MAG: ATP-binding protein [Chitinophagaceae bacterium]|nr:ATP-binding protein [Chitinophagaceae bacterium]